MSHWRTFVNVIKTAPKNDIIVLLVTFVLTVVFDLVIAIEVGMLLACILFIKRMSEETSVVPWKYKEQLVDEDSDSVKQKLMDVPKYIRVYEISGPLFFGAADQIERIELKSYTEYLIIRMRSVPAMDSTAMNSMSSLKQRCDKKGITMIFSHVNEQPMKAMKKSGLYKDVGADNFKTDISSAITYAEELSSAKVSQ
jgi:SulP family sulfate permease